MPGVYPRLCVNSLAVSATFRPSGVLVPLVTPFDDRGAVDFDALGALATRALDAGAAGVVALATTGEPTSLDDGERTAVVAVCAEACAGRDAVLGVGAGTDDTRTTIACHAARGDVAAPASLALGPC